MNALRAALAAIAEHGASVLFGVTIVLACGVVVMLCHRSPVQRKHLGVLTAIGVLLYLLVGLAPLPRLAVHGAAGDASAVVAALPTAATAPTLDADARAAMLLRAMQGLTSPPSENGIAASAASGASMAAPVAAAATAVASAPSPFVAWAASVPWSLVVAGLYVLGAAFWLVRTIGAQLRLASLLASCRPVPAAALRFAGVPAGLRVVSTTRSLRPFCAGIRRPVIVLPEALLAADRVAEATAVLRHEVAHVRAQDPRLWSLLAWLAVPLWCHPLFWWLCREVRFCSELLADDDAARRGDRQRYARALIDLAERSGHAVAAAGTVAIFHRPSEFYRRIQMLLSRQGSLSTSTSRVRRFAQSFSMLCLVGAAASAFGVPAAAQDPARTLRRENADLRATLDTLRTELANLRDQIAALRAASTQSGLVLDLVRAQSRSAPTELQWRLEVQKLAAEGKPSQDSTAANPIEATPPADPLAVLRAAAAQDPVAPPSSGVPVLGRLPLLGNLFRQSAEAAAAPALELPANPQPELLPVVFGRLDEHGNLIPARDYVVKKGDTLDRIARRELGSPDRIGEILEHNHGLEPQKLRPGQQLKLPGLALPPAGLDPLAGAAGAPADGATASDGPADLGTEARLRELLAARGFAAASSESVPAPAPAPTGIAALAELTSRYLDLQADLEVQKIEAAEAKSMADAGHATQRESRRAEVTLRATEKKLAIAKHLIDGEIAATESELQWIEKRRADCSPSEAMQLDMQARRARTRLEALQAVK